MLEETLSSIESLEKWHGNLYNWYRISDLAPMEPKYVSSVDSGNFLCCLLACRGMLSDMLRHSIMDGRIKEGMRTLLMSIVDEKRMEQELYEHLRQYESAIAGAEKISSLCKALRGVIEDGRLDSVKGIKFVRDMYSGFEELYKNLGIEDACSASLHEISMNPDNYFKDGVSKSRALDYIAR